MKTEIEEFEVKDGLHCSVNSRLALFSKECGLTNTGARRLSKYCYGSFVIQPNGSLYRYWLNIIFLWSIYSAFFTPFEFGFFRGLPKRLAVIDSIQIIFLIDIILKFFIAYRDDHTYKMVYDQKSIALRYLKGHFFLDLLGCFPWDAIYKGAGRRELIRYLVWTRLYRVKKITRFFKKMEKDIRINYMFTRIVKLITVELYCTHTAACIFYYLATTIPPSEEGYTWIGSLTLGDYKYINFREIDLWRRYITSLYFAIVTMATVGAYLIGNMTALIVKGSKTERFRDKMTDLIKYMNRNKLNKDIRNQIKNHFRLQYESSYTKASVLEDIPVAVKAKISQSLYLEMVQKVPLFKGCSDEFLNQMVIKLNEEFFLPGEVILEQGSAVDQIYIICLGTLEEVVTRENGAEETISELVPCDIFGDVAVLCNIPQPYTVNVCELCRLLRMDKQSLTGILQVYFKDSQQILSNLLKGKETGLRKKQLESDINYLITKQEAELALRVNSAAYHGDLHHLKGLINAGADPNKTDYDGRTALQLAASRGYEDIVRFLIQCRADVNCTDKFGNSLLAESVKAGHERVSKLLVENGAILNIEDAGTYLCKIVAESKIDILCRLLEYGIDPNCKNFDRRTPLHVAAAEGLHLLATVLLKFGADIFSQDRWGNTPLDEGKRCGSRPLIKILEHARQSQTCRSL